MYVEDAGDTTQERALPDNKEVALGGQVYTRLLVWFCAAVGMGTEEHRPYVPVEAPVEEVPPVVPRAPKGHRATLYQVEG